MVRTYIRSIYTSFATHVLDVPPRLLALLLFLLFLAYPVTKPNLYYLFVLSVTNIMAIFAASWDLLVGRTGQMSLGHALFFGVGAYSTALLFRFYRLPLWATIPLGILISALVAVAVGFPCLRVKGPYLALVSMAFPLIGTGIVFYFRIHTGGEEGVWGLPKFFPMLNMYDQRLAEYYLTLILLLFSGIILYKIANSRTGIVMVSILDDELASKACGINVTKYKLMAFVISAVFAGLAGAVYAHFLTIAGYDTLSLGRSFEALILTILGGIGTIYGAIAGSFVFNITGSLILDEMGIPDVWTLLIFIVIVVVFVMKWPRGFARFAAEKLGDLSEERELEERGEHIWKKYGKKKEKK